MKFILAIFVYITLINPSGAQTQSFRPRYLTSGEKDLISNTVFKILKYPDSAFYDWLPFNELGKYCGKVNFKNSYGGYDGYTYFLINVEKNISGEIVSAREPSIIANGMASDLIAKCTDYTE